VQPCFLALPGEAGRREHAAVRGDLDVVETHVPGHPDDVEELRVKGRLAAGKLDVAAGQRLVIDQRGQHAPDGLDVEVVDILVRPPGEADRAREITAVSEIDQGQERRLARVIIQVRIGPA
jgi:hypothetical protein